VTTLAAKASPAPGLAAMGEGKSSPPVSSFHRPIVDMDKPGRVGRPMPSKADSPSVCKASTAANGKGAVKHHVSNPTSIATQIWPFRRIGDHLVDVATQVILIAADSRHARQVCVKSGAS
jgi:hypothetical protein